VIVADVGNTHTRLALWQNGAYAARLTLATRRPQPHRLRAWLYELPVPAASLVARLASVVPQATAEVTAAFAERGVACHVLRPGYDPVIAHDLTAPESTGIDRLCAARAGWERLGRGHVVIDAGSAVTVDAVNDRGVFLGGAILPGPAMWLESLQADTAQITDLIDAERYFAALKSIGRNTAEALGAGLRFGLVGAVDALVNAHRERLGLPEAPVLLTGGAAPFLGPRLATATTPLPDLVLDGIRLSAAAEDPGE
jgi:type III pantothenate kinase